MLIDRQPRAQQEPRNDSKSNVLHERFLFASVALIGREVEVECRKGVVYRGILHRLGTDKKSGIVLKLARTIENENAVLKPAPIPTLVIDSSDYLQLKAVGVPLYGSGFATDTEISGQSRVGERELQAWQPDSDSGALEELEGPTGKWDQFEVNRTKFNVESTWDENLYTTELKKGGSDYHAREARAQRLAREIEGSTSANPHIAEERGHEDKSGLDEEKKYSEVVRSTLPAEKPTTKTEAKTEAKVETKTEAEAEKPKPTLSKLKLNPNAKEWVPSSIAVPEPEPEYDEYYQQPYGGYYGYAPPYYSAPQGYYAGNPGNNYYPPHYDQQN